MFTYPFLLDSPETKLKNKSVGPLLMLLISCLLIIHCESQTIEVNTPNLDFYSYVDEKSDNKKIEGEKLNLKRGEWMFFPKLNRLEFHSSISGMLILSSFTDRQFIYLEGSSRVLVFPLMDNDALPFVDVSKIDEVNTKDPEEYILLYAPNKNLDISKKFTEYKNQLFTPEQLAGNMSNLNQIPYYQLIRRKKSKMVWSNKFGYFNYSESKDFSEWAFTKIPPPIIQIGSNWSEVDNFELQKGVIATFLKVVLFKNSNFFAEDSLNEEEKMRSFRVDALAMEAANDIIQNDPSIQETLKSYCTQMWWIAEGLVGSLVRSPNFAFFSHSFFDFESGVTMSQHIQNRKKDYERFPMKESIQDYMIEIFDMSDFKGTPDTYNGLYEDEVEELEDIFKKIARSVYDNVESHLEKLLPNESETIFDEFIASDEASDEEKIAGTTVKTETYLPLTTRDESNNILTKLVAKKTQLALIFKLQIMYFLPEIMNIVEPELLRNLDDFGIFEKMEMKFSEDQDGIEALEAFRRSLMVFGFVSYEDSVDRSMYRHESKTIFKVQNRLLLV